MEDGYKPLTNIFEFSGSPYAIQLGNQENLGLILVLYENKEIRESWCCFNRKSIDEITIEEIIKEVVGFLNIRVSNPYQIMQTSKTLIATWGRELNKSK